MRRTMRHCSSWLLLLGIAVSFFAFLNGADLYQSVQNALAEANDFRYKNSYSIQVAEIHDADKLLNQIKEMKGNIFMDNLLVKIDREGEYHLAEILLKQDEKLPYPFLYGNNNFESDKMQVIIGKALTKDCFTKQNDEKRYICIDEKEYEVIGVIGSEDSDILDGKLIFQLNADTLDTYISRQDIFSFQYGTNASDINQNITQLYEKLSPECDLYFEKDASAYIEVGSDSEDEKFYWLICVFSIINCVVISEFWIIRRKQEIVIRKLWGYSNWKLFLTLYREMLLIAFLAVSMIWIIQPVMVSLGGRTAGVGFSLHKLLYSAIFIFISAWLIVLVPIHNVSQYTPCKGLEG